MYERGRNLLLSFLKVPLEPHPPLGDPASLRVFRAGRNYFRLRVFTWGLAQTLALAGIIFWAVVLVQVEAEVQARRQARATAVTPPAVAAPAASAVSSATAPAGARPAKDSKVESFQKSLNQSINAAKKRGRIDGWAGFKLFFVELALLLPPWALPVLWLLKILGFTLYLVQIPITYAVRRLEYETHWYMVTDRSLRLRTGVWKVQELTMSFANLQQVVVSQGPLQRLLGLGDVQVQSAGGASGAEHTREAQQNSLHSGYFHSVDNASEIRDLILERLRRFRESGLGDPEEIRRAPAVATSAMTSSAQSDASELLAAAREFRDEARALRTALG